MTHRSMMSVGLLLYLSLAASVALGAVRAWVDNDASAPDGTVQLTLEHDGQTNDEPDLTPLKQNFDVLSSSRSTTMQITNGSVSSHVQVQVALSPKRTGDLPVPPISWAGEQSAPLTVHVGNGAASNAAGASASKLFLETTIDTARPYVQAGVKLTVRVFAAVPIYHASLDLPANNDVLVQQVGADDNETQIRDGVRYQVIERHYELFPQRSGPLTAPGPVLDAQIAVQDRSLGSLRDFFGNSAFANMMPLSNLLTRTKAIRVHGDPIALNVLPRPAGAATDYWIPARGLTLDGGWHADQQLKAGDPITLDLHLRARDLTAAQLPDLSTLLKLPAGLKAYPDQAKLSNDAQGGTLLGTRDQSIAVIADKPGQFTVPALTVHWWDTQSNGPREATLPARTFSIAPAQATTASQPAVAPGAPMAIAAGSGAPKAPASVSPRPDQGNPWRWVSLALCVLWMLTLLAWYLTRRRPRPARPAAGSSEERAVPAARARAAFHGACRSDDARAARAALLAWIRAARPDAPAAGLRSLAQRGQDAQLSALLLELERACYGGGRWSGSALLQALHELPRQAIAPREPEEELLPLYR